ncbi:hypothetical protein C1H46_041007 [Malus baccata]|uniref:Uncharacterized protein n=1 Tax=Malus baccata TaxID=106549 RepID=A0A540KGY2_MALBA|nr:hypothetical protein C1H46_041007 [Malus baccata]
MKRCWRNWSASSSTSSLAHVTRFDGQLPGPKHLQFSFNDASLSNSASTHELERNFKFQNNNHYFKKLLRARAGEQSHKLEREYSSEKKGMMNPIKLNIFPFSALFNLLLGTPHEPSKNKLVWFDKTPRFSEVIVAHVHSLV